MAKRILLQCHRISYFYMGLGAIYTKFPNKDEVLVDVLYTINDYELSSVDYIKDNKNINQFFVCIHEDEIKNSYNEIAIMDKNIKNHIHFHLNCKNKIIKTMRNIWHNNKYDYCFCCEGDYISDMIYFANPAKKYVLYGDGPGIIYHVDYTKLINFHNNYKKPYFVKNMHPDEIIGLAPFKMDNSFDTKNIPVLGTNPEILLNLIESDTKIQNIINEFADDIEKNYKNYDKKILFLDSNIQDPRFMMSKEEQINLYIDIINKNTTKDSLFILKNHPASKVDYSILSEKCKCKLLIFPKELQMLPIELFSKFIKEIDAIIPFISGAGISLKILYGIENVSVFDILQNYNIKYRINPDLLFYDKVMENLKDWDKKSFVYQADIIPEHKKFYDLYEKDSNKQNDSIVNSRKNSFLENIFSVRNIINNEKKYKVITIFYLKFKFVQVKTH